jgi:D-tyrosyl-tRNA(Tyr) deacylase
LSGGHFDVTVTLTDHGPRTIDLPANAETAAVADHRAVAEALGV